jgi:DNA helicase-2/ATP-dependent DNA helicase PcrA
MTPNHPAFFEEQQHLETTLRMMKQIIDDLEQDIDVRVHKTNRALSIKDEVSAYVHSLMKSDHAYKIHDIQAALDNPYFGRVDFREDGAEDFEPFYIGRTKIAKLDIQSVADILVFDWRDPVSTIFYECQDGRASYEVLGRYTYTGDVRLKRQFKIEDGQLLAISEDTILNKLIIRQQEALIADPFLLQRLLQGAGDRLKDIVTSIRSEQNQIIREPLNQVTIIQGVAGSGKSTIGLHRLSYLLYNEKLDPTRLTVIAPNRIFLNYISDLLPDIDAQDVHQQTFGDLAAAIMQLHPVIREQDACKAMREQLADVAKWKGAPEFAEVLKTFVDRRLEKFCLKLENLILFDGLLVITKEQQLEKVVEGAHVPYNDRLRTLARYIRFRVNNFLEVLRAKHNRGDQGPDRKTLDRWDEESDLFLDRYSIKMPFMELISGYTDVFKDKPAWKPAKRRAFDMSLVTSHSLPILQSGQIERDDLAPLCYLKYLLDGVGHIDKYDHIVVDEGQDLSPLEYIILAQVSRNTSFTIMGDMLQGIHAERGLDSWDTLLKEIFGDAKCRYYEVNYSYRSAKEIVDLFNSVMPSGRSRAIPVYEIGRQPDFAQVPSHEAGLDRVVQTIQDFRDWGCKSIGILARLPEDSEALYEKLRHRFPLDDSPSLITSNSASYQGGITVAPIALAKGLEFDGVILWNASDREFGSDYYDAKLLYVALSRAMYHLRILYQGRLSPLLR